MRTFRIETLGCKVNFYESEQIAAVLRARGLVEAAGKEPADLRVVNTCSVTVQAASKSRQTVRRNATDSFRKARVHLPVLQATTAASVAEHSFGQESDSPDASGHTSVGAGSRVVVTGCWATSNPDEAKAISRVDAVITHHENVSATLNRLLDRWMSPDEVQANPAALQGKPTELHGSPSIALGDDGSIKPGANLEGDAAVNTKARYPSPVKQKMDAGPRRVGTSSLPLLGERQASHQRAFLKIQDGCDAHCTYCIIPKLRPGLWSKPVAEVVEEATRLVDAGHVEIVLTGIFLGAYGQATALRRRQNGETGKRLGGLIDALCGIDGLRRVRLSSLEPGDLTAELIDVCRQRPQVVPHFHLPLQSGSDAILRRMNRQYSRQEFLDMVEEVKQAFDRPALTTDIICGFPGETEEEFERTAEVVERAGFIHVHAFGFSPRPGTAAARWERDFVRGPVVNERIDRLNAMARRNSEAFRRQFVGETVEVLVERGKGHEALRHGRCERYFPVHFAGQGLTAGDAVRVRITHVDADRTLGEVVR